MDLVQLLDGIVPVEDHRVPGKSGGFAPLGVMVHHTAGTDSHSTVINGRKGLSGPLCNLLIRKDGVVEVITDGKANDSGKGSSVVLEEVKANTAPSGDARDRNLRDDVNGNPYFYDVEVENLGNGQDPYPDVQLDALVKVCAAILAEESWSANRVIHHREWTKRKIDMSWRGDLRGLVAAALAGEDPKPAPAPTPKPAPKPAPKPKPTPSGSIRVEASVPRLVRRGDKGRAVKAVQGLVNAHGQHPQIAVDGDFGPRTEQAVREFQHSVGIGVDGLVGSQTWGRLLRFT